MIYSKFHLLVCWKNYKRLWAIEPLLEWRTNDVYCNTTPQFIDNCDNYIVFLIDKITIDSNV